MREEQLFTDPRRRLNRTEPALSCAVPTGRKLIQEALREPMRQLGWTPRAAGWFTKDHAPEVVGIIAVGTASQHHAPGSVSATLYVHLRDERVEQLVSRICGTTDAGYRTATATSSIGYLMPEAAWREWLVAPNNVDAVAREMANAADMYVDPYLSQLANDPQRLLEAVTKSAAYSTALGLCRAVVLLEQMGDQQGALTVLDEWLLALGVRADPAAQRVRESADSLRRWLESGDP
jgi:hypothetical protein